MLFSVIGSALKVLGRPLYETFADLRAQYGDIFTINIAGTEVVVINGYEAIHEALVKQAKDFSGRPDITWTSITQKRGMFIYGPETNLSVGTIITGYPWKQDNSI